MAEQIGIGKTALCAKRAESPARTRAHHRRPCPGEAPLRHARTTAPLRAPSATHPIFASHAEVRTRMARRSQRAEQREAMEELWRRATHGFTTITAPARRAAQTGNPHAPRFRTARLGFRKKRPCVEIRAPHAALPARFRAPPPALRMRL